MNGFKSAVLFLLSLYGLAPRGRRPAPIQIGRAAPGR